MRAFALAALLVAATACAGGDEVSGDRRAVGGVTVVFSIRPARTEVGKPVRLTLRLTNNSGRATMLEFSSAQTHDFWVTREGREVWRWSADMAFTQQLQDRSIDPFGSLTFSDPWTPSASGEYIAHAEVKARGYGHDLTGKVMVGG